MKVEKVTLPTRLRALARTRASGLLLLVALLALWEVSAAAGWVRSDNWPRFSSILQALISGLRSGELAVVLGTTLYRMTVGFASGTLVAVFMGVMLGRFRLADEALRPVLEVLRTLPSPAIVPPLILLLGVDDALKIVTVALAAFAPVFVNTYAGVRRLDETLALTAKTFGLGSASTVWRIVLPSSVPAIAAGMRVSLALSLIVTVIAEMVSGSSGVGYYLLSMQFAMRAADMYAAIVCLALAGYVINLAFLLAEKRVLHWYVRNEN